MPALTLNLVGSLAWGPHRRQRNACGVGGRGGHQGILHRESNPQRPWLASWRQLDVTWDSCVGESVPHRLEVLSRSIRVSTAPKHQLVVTILVKVLLKTNHEPGRWLRDHDSAPIPEGPAPRRKEALQIAPRRFVRNSRAQPHHDVEAGDHDAQHQEQHAERSQDVKNHPPTSFASRRCARRVERPEATEKTGDEETQRHRDTEEFLVSLCLCVFYEAAVDSQAHSLSLSKPRCG